MSISRNAPRLWSTNFPCKASCKTRSSRKKSASNGEDGCHVYRSLSDPTSCRVGLPVFCSVDQIRVPPDPARMFSRFTTIIIPATAPSMCTPSNPGSPPNLLMIVLVATTYRLSPVQRELGCSFAVDSQPQTIPQRTFARRWKPRLYPTLRVPPESYEYDVLNHFLYLMWLCGYRIQIFPNGRPLYR